MRDNKFSDLQGMITHSTLSDHATPPQLGQPPASERVTLLNYYLAQSDTEATAASDLM